jgi:alpha/beta superfamily hydrolase
MRSRPFAWIAIATLIAPACGVTSSSSGGQGIQITTTTAAAGTTAASPPQSTTTTVAATVPELDVTIEPSGWEDVTITTEDGIDLHGEFWQGGDLAVLVGHDFDNPTPGATGQRAPQSSEVQLPYTAAIAREGYTTLAFDFRGHGESGGEYDVRASQLDLAAAYQWLRAEGYERIVMVGWVGSGTAAVVLDAARDDIAFAGIAMLFSPPQDTGLDASRVVGEIEAPMWFVGSNAGQSASWARRLEAKALDSRGVVVFERVPTGVTFIDVFGGELAGRIVDFLASV